MSALTSAFGPTEGALSEKEKKQFESATIALGSKCTQFSAARTLLDPSSPGVGDDVPSWLSAALRTSGPVNSVGMGARFVQAVHFDNSASDVASSSLSTRGGSSTVPVLSDPWANSDSDEEQPASLSWKQQLEQQVPITSLQSPQIILAEVELVEGTPEADPNWGRPLPAIPSAH